MCLRIICALSISLRSRPDYQAACSLPEARAACTPWRAACIPMSSEWQSWGQGWWWRRNAGGSVEWRRQGGWTIGEGAWRLRPDRPWGTYLQIEVPFLANQITSRRPDPTVAFQTLQNVLRVNWGCTLRTAPYVQYVRTHARTYSTSSLTV